MLFLPALPLSTLQKFERQRDVAAGEIYLMFALLPGLSGRQHDHLHPPAHPYHQSAREGDQVPG